MAAHQHVSAAAPEQVTLGKSDEGPNVANGGPFGGQDKAVSADLDAGRKYYLTLQARAALAGFELVCMADSGLTPRRRGEARKDAQHHGATPDVAAPELAHHGVVGPVPLGAAPARAVVAPINEKAPDAANVEGPGQTKTHHAIFAQPADDGKRFSTLLSAGLKCGDLARAACTCRFSAPCSTCTAWCTVFDDLAARNAVAAERAAQAHLNRLALDRQQDATRRRPVRDTTRRLRVDLDALADAVALRLRRAP